MMDDNYMSYTIPAGTDIFRSDHGFWEYFVTQREVVYDNTDRIVGDDLVDSMVFRTPDPRFPRIKVSKHVVICSTR